MKTVIKACRFPKELLDKLTREAKSQGTNTNNLIMRKLTAYESLNDLHNRVALLEVQIGELKERIR